MANSKRIGALLATFAFGGANLASAGEDAKPDAPKADAKKAGKKGKKGGDADKKGGEKACGGEKGCGGDKKAK